jgi:hypothetical protein
VLSFALQSLTFAGRIASLRVNSTVRFSVVDASINQFSVFLSLLASRQGPLAPSGFHRLSSLLWAPPTPSPSSPQCYCLPLQALQLYPSLGWVSQVPDCSFRARCPTIPRKVPVGVSVIFSPPGCWLPFPRESWPLSSFLVSRLSYAGSLSLRLALSLSRGFKRPVSQSPALVASCLMTLYTANSFHLARTTKLRLALRGRGRRRASRTFGCGFAATLHSCEVFSLISGKE